PRRVSAASRARTLLTAGREKAAGSSNGRQPEGRGRFGSEIALSCSGAEGFAEFASRTRFNSGREFHYGSARRGRGGYQEYCPAQRVCAAVDPAHGGEALSEFEGRSAGLLH